MNKVVVIGAGQVGKVLGHILNHSGKFKVIGVWSKDSNNAKEASRFIGKNVLIFKDKKQAAQAGDIVFITSPDSVIQQVAEEIFAGNAEFANKVIIHCSGSLPSSILKSAKKHHNVSIASIHPLQTFPSGGTVSPSSGRTCAHNLEAVKNFKGTYCVYEGEAKATKTLKALIKALGGTPVQIRPEHKTLYHIGCVFACNYLVTLINTSFRLLKSCGFNDKDILPAIRPLINTTLKNIKTLGIAYSLTGPIARGDVLTIKNHIAAIKKRAPDYLRLYRELARHTVKIAKTRKVISLRQLSSLQREIDDEYSIDWL